MYMRFVTTRMHRKSRQQEGLFAAASDLLWSDGLESGERQRLTEMLAWFNRNLPSPPCHFCVHRAVFWFKPAARESIRRMWELVFFLRLHGFHIEVHKCRRLWRVAWQDDHQVAACSTPRDGRVTIQ